MTDQSHITWRGEQDSASKAISNKWRHYLFRPIADRTNSASERWFVHDLLRHFIPRKHVNVSQAGCLKVQVGRIFFESRAVMVHTPGSFDENAFCYELLQG